MHGPVVRPTLDERPLTQATLSPTLNALPAFKLAVRNSSETHQHKYLTASPHFCRIMVILTLLLSTSPRPLRENGMSHFSPRGCLYMPWRPSTPILSPFSLLIFVTRFPFLIPVFRPSFLRNDRFTHGYLIFCLSLFTYIEFN